MHKRTKHKPRPTALKPVATAPWVGYTGCKGLPMSVFIVCATTGDLSGLTIAGVPAPDQLQRRWTEIHAEYCDKIGGDKLNARDAKVRQANGLAAKIRRIAATVALLRELWLPGGVVELRIDYPALTLDVTDEEQYGKDLDRIEAFIKRDRVTLATLHDAIGSEAVTVATEEHYQANLLDLSKMQGYPIRADQIDVLEYCMLVRRRAEQVEAIKNQQKNR